MEQACTKQIAEPATPSSFIIKQVHTLTHKNQNAGRLRDYNRPALTVNLTHKG
jgi:hypothetical protein